MRLYYIRGHAPGNKRKMENMVACIHAYVKPYRTLKAAVRALRVCRNENYEIIEAKVVLKVKT